MTAGTECVSVAA